MVLGKVNSIVDEEGSWVEGMWTVVWDNKTRCIWCVRYTHVSSLCIPIQNANIFNTTLFCTPRDNPHLINSLYLSSTISFLDSSPFIAFSSFLFLSYFGIRSYAFGLGLRFLF